MMFGNNTQVFIAINPVDMRKSINGLSSLVAGEFSKNPLTDGLIVFSNSSRKIIKVLYWHFNGFCLWQKRLEKGRFIWPDNREEVMSVGVRELGWLVEGLNIGQLKAHKQLGFNQVY